MKLLLVHGRGQGGISPQKLQADWLGALNEGLQRAGLTMPQDVDVSFPYYGDLLDKFVADFDLPVGTEVVAKGGALDATDIEYARFRAVMAEEIRTKAAIGDAEVLATADTGVIEKGIQNWFWIRATVRVIDRRFPGASGFTIEKFIQDVFLYTQRRIVRDAIDKLINEKLTNEPTLVIAHSLGSVVAYNVLRNGRPGLNVPLFVTVGSPLGIRAISRSLGPLKNPMSRGGWYNAFDPRDIVSLNPLDPRNFNVNPSITNYGGVRNSTDNCHGIIGYLDDATVAAAIRGNLS